MKDGTMLRFLSGAMVVTALVLAGCGGGGGGKAPDADPQPAPSVPPAPAPEPAPVPAPAPAPLRASLIAFVAGSLQRAGGQDGIGAAAQFNRPQGVAVDYGGNIYIADTGNHTIRKLSPDGTVVTLGGSPGAAGAVDGPGAAARFSSPEGIAVDASGNVFVADTGNHAIRMISPAGLVTVLAGATGEAGDVEGRGSAARFNTPVRVAIDGRGNLLVADRGNKKIRRIASNGDVSTFWSDPTLPQPLTGVGVDGAGNVFIARRDGNYSFIRKFDSEGRELAWPDAVNGYFSPPVTTDIAVRSDGAVYVASGGFLACGRYPCYASSVGFVSPTGAVSRLAGDGALGYADGPGAQARFDMPSGIAVTADGRAIVADTENSAIRQIDGQGVVTTLAGGLGRGKMDGAGATARFDHPEGIAAGPDGALYVADRSNHAVRRIGADGAVSTVRPLAADGGPQPLYGNLTGMAADRQGTVYVAGYGSFYPPGSSYIYALMPSGLATQVAGPAYGAPAPIAVDDGLNLYVLNDAHDGIDVVAPGRPKRVLVPGSFRLLALAAGAGEAVYAATADTVLAINAKGETSVVAGRSGEPGFKDGPGADSRFADISALALDRSGNLYIADGSLTIRRLSADGMVRTIAGTPGQTGPAPGPAPGVLGAVKGMTWFANALYLTVGNAILKLTFQE